MMQNLRYIFKLLCVYWLCLWLVMPVNARNILALGHNSSASANRRPGTSPQYIGQLTNAANRSRLAAATQAVVSAQNMQQAAHNAALGMNGNIASGLGLGGNGFLPGLVPNTQFVNGQPVNPLSWVNAKQPTESVSNGVTMVDIKQTGEQAVLFWKNFNISRDTILNFDQSLGGTNVGNWVAINEISNNMAPSEISGKINAQGSVYIINQNGIIFHGSSQINTHTLVASALAINDNLVKSGLLNNQNSLFLFDSTVASTVATSTGYLQTVGGTTTLPVPSSSEATRYQVSVENGAALNSTPIDLTGGKIALIGEKVTNNGSLSATNGQIILAAGAQVGWSAHDANDSSLRGVDVYVGSPGSTFTDSGTATNNGLIDSPQGDVVMTGKTLNQNGVINSTTSVNFNGRIDLLALYGASSFYEGNSAGSTTLLTNAPIHSGQIIFGASSLTQILPETDSLDRIAGTLAHYSSINVIGSDITMQDQATVFAPGAKNSDGEVILSLPAYDASKNQFFTNTFNPSSGVYMDAGQFNLIYKSGGSTPASSTDYVTGDIFAPTKGTITLGNKATIDVSGVADINASVLENIVAVQLRGPELANSPLQRNGILRGQTIYLDLSKAILYNGQYYYGTALANFAGYYANIQRTVGELSINGGTVSLSAGTKVNLGAGSQINVSGGWINYQGSLAPVTYVLEDGHWIDISQALPNVTYNSLNQGAFSVVHPHWAVTSNYFNPLGPVKLGGYTDLYNNTGVYGISTITGLMDQLDYVPGYVYGGNGGGITLMAPRMTLDGTLLGNTVMGILQRVNAPVSSSLDLELYGESVSAVAAADGFLQPVQSSYFNTNGIKTNVEIGDTQLTPIAADGSNLFVASAVVNQNGFGNLTIKDGDGNITLDGGTSLIGSAGGNITLNGANINISGNIIVPSGKISLTANDFSPTVYAAYSIAAFDTDKSQFLSLTQKYDPARGNVEINGNLDTKGFIIDDSFTSPTFNTIPLTISDGSFILGASKYTNGSSTLNGGTVSIQAYTIHLDQASTVDVSAGVRLTPTLATSYGAGGAISLETFYAPPSLNVQGLNQKQNPIVLPQFGLNYLDMEGTLRGYGGMGKNGGSLSLVDLLNVTISDFATKNTYQISPSFFDQDGFTTYNIDSYIDGTKAKALTISSSFYPQALSEYASYENNQLQLTEMLPTLSQRSPISINLSAQTLPSSTIKLNSTQVSAGSASAGAPITLNAGTIIQFDPNSQSNFTLGSSITTVASVYGAPGIINIEGDIFVPGGSINISAGGVSQSDLVSLTLGSGSILSAAGASVQTPNGLGYYTGSVLDGGTIALKGNINALPGALVDVQGAVDTFYVDPSVAELYPTLQRGLNQTRLVPLTEYSNGGTVKLSGTNFILWNGTINANSGGGNAAQGTLAVTSGNMFNDPSLAATSSTYNLLPSTPNITIESDPAQLPTLVDLTLAYTHPGSSNNYSKYQYGGAFISASTLNNSNLGEIDLNGTNASFNQQFVGSPVTGLTGAVDFVGDVTLQASRTLKIGSGGFMEIDHVGARNSINKVTLNAPYVALGSIIPYPISSAQLQTLAQTSLYNYSAPGNGNLNQDPFYIGPTLGNAYLKINANLIDVGYLSLAGMERVTLNSAGDIRGSGTLNANGTLYLQARQIYTPTADTFNIVCFNHINISSTGPEENLPLSGGGNINIYAPNINQDGVVVAPFGTITLGWNGVGARPIDLITGSGILNSSGKQVLSSVPESPVNILENGYLTLGPKSVTSVSGVDPLTGQGITVPYGFALNGGNQWIDPTGTDITSIGVPDKKIVLAGQHLNSEKGSIVDLRGGGDLYAYRFVSGTSGTNDLLDSTYSPYTYAVIPGNPYGYAPLGAYNTTVGGPVTNINGSGTTDNGYVPNSSTQVGDEVYLAGSNGLPAGYYTLLPARYGTLPGAVLVTQEPNTEVSGSLNNADGSSLVSGFIVNGLNGSQRKQGMLAFEIDPQNVINNKVQYDLYHDVPFFRNTATVNETAIPLLSNDGGQLTIQAQSTLNLQGTGQFQAQDGLAGIADIDTIGQSILISEIDSKLVPQNPYISLYLTLFSDQLSNFGAESLLIGGTRAYGTNGYNVTVDANNVEVGVVPPNVVNSSPVHDLSGSDIILVAKHSLQLDQNAQIDAIPGFATTAKVNITGDGTLLRVTSDPSTQFSRTEKSGEKPLLASNDPNLILKSNSSIKGAGVILDTTLYSEVDPTASITAESLTFVANQIIIDPTNATVTGTTGAAPVTFYSQQIHQLNGCLNLNLISDTTIDFYGNVTLGQSAQAQGLSTINNLTLDAEEIRGYNTGVGAGNVTLNATNITLNNVEGGTGLGIDSSATNENNITLNAVDHVYLGATPQTLRITQDNAFPAIEGNLVTVTSTVAGVDIGSILKVGQKVSGAGTLDGTYIDSIYKIGAGFYQITLNQLLESVDLSQNVTVVNPQSHAVTVLDKSIIPSLQVTGTLSLDQFNKVVINAPHGLEFQGSGNYQTLAPVTLKTPFVTTASGAIQSFTTSGDLVIKNLGNRDLAPGLGGQLSLTANSILDDTLVQLSSGKINLEATGGKLELGSNANFNVQGTVEQVNDYLVYTNAGSISLTSDTGSVVLDPGSILNLAAQTGGGNGGSLSIDAASGTVSLNGFLNGGGGSGGVNGLFSMNVKTLPTNKNGQQILSGYDTILNSSGFTQSRSYEVASGDVVVDGTADAYNYNVSADGGSIEVTSTGLINASGTTGGKIHLVATGDVTLDNGAILNASGDKFGNNGKGGEVDLFAGSEINGLGDPTASVNIGSGSIINLDIGKLAQNIATEKALIVQDQVSAALDQTMVATDNTNVTTDQNNINADQAAHNSAQLAIDQKKLKSDQAKTNSDEFQLTKAQTQLGIDQASLAADNTILANQEANGQFQGILHLRQAQDNKGVLVLNPIEGSVIGGSYIAMEGYSILNVGSKDIYTSLSGSPSSDITKNGALLENNNDVSSLVDSSNINFTAPIYLTAGVEVINLGKNNNPMYDDINLGVNESQGLDLSQVRFQSTSKNNTYLNGKSENVALPGYLTLRAAGNIVLQASISDGFIANTLDNDNGTGASFDAIIETKNSSLVANFQTFSYTFAAGANFSSADPSAVLSLEQVTNPYSGLSKVGGSLQLGINGYTDNSNPNNANNNIGEFNASTSNFNAGGSTDYYQVIRTGSGDININTAGNIDLMNIFATIYTAGTTAPAFNNFDIPSPNSLVPVATYTYAGGNVNLNAGFNIEHITKTGSNVLLDSQIELPMNWLLRRGERNSDGTWATTQAETLSTSWWVDFTNFFEGIGALGGGDVTMIAGHDITNVDAVIPTNERTANVGATTLELGGGNLIVNAGNNIDGGVYYIERGQGTLAAGNSIITNYTRDTDFQNFFTHSFEQAESAVANTGQGAWMNTTLFLGQGSFNIEAENSINLGPVLDVFLQPQDSRANLRVDLSNNNSKSDSYISYFSTYAPSSSVNAQTNTGNITLQIQSDGNPIISNYYTSLIATTAVVGFFGLEILDSNNSSAQYVAASSLFPGSVSLVAPQGSINLIAGGNSQLTTDRSSPAHYSAQINLYPSSSGHIDLIAGSDLNGLNLDNSYDVILNSSITNKSGSGSITNDYYDSAVIDVSNADPSSFPSYLNPIKDISSMDQYFGVTGATNSNINTQLALNDTLILHNKGVVSQIYSKNGDISGLTLFSSTATRVSAGNDLTDVGLYLQNNYSTDVSVISAGNDMILYDPTSPIRTAAFNTVNAIAPTGYTQANQNIDGNNNGDIQISGPGTLEVLAGRNVTLGAANNNGDGTGLGITSVGNQVNPFIGDTGANLVVAAGLGSAEGLNSFNFSAFNAAYLDPATAGANAATYDADLYNIINDPTSTSTPTSDQGTQAWNTFEKLSQDQKNVDSLDAFYLVLRDAGRAHTTGSGAASGYPLGFDAISKLIVQPGASGDINMVQREINNMSTGEIDLLAPSGNVEVGLDASSSNQAQDQGIFTQGGGNINIFAQDNVDLGASRVFTLRGGNIVVWSSYGGIAAGSSSKTVAAAPPTRVVIDGVSANVSTDLGGVATGGGIGVLASIPGVPTGNVDLVAPNGTIDAGDAGIRSTGNVHLAALQILNADNITAGGTITGAPKTSSSPVSPSSNNTNPAATSGIKTILGNEIEVHVVGYGEGTPPDASSQPAPSEPQYSGTPSSPSQGESDSDLEKKKKKANP